MGIFDRFGRNEPQPTAPAQQLPAEGLAGSATRLVERLLDVGIDGKAQFDSARTVADNHRARQTSDEKAIDAVINDHLKLAAAGGFVTGLGGFVTLPVALPANVAGFYIIATRMAAAIAHLRGYDIQQREVRSAILLSLVGADSDDLLKKAGYASTGRLSNLAAQRLPGPVLMAVNKGVGFRLLSQVGRKTFAKLGRGVPLIGGVIGAGLDGYMVKQIADHVRSELPRRDPALPTV